MNLQFHLYGLIVGVAIVSAITLIEKQYKKLGYSEKNFWKIIIICLIFGTIGARIWHIATDYNLYANNLIEVFYIWNGGLSIFGGILGGVIGVYLSSLYFQEISFLKFLDIAVFGLPIGQTIGRLGNFINQELYGIPITDSMFSIFKIYISPENRLIGYENVEYYHPLFFYEMVATFSFGMIIYYLNSKNKLSKIGTGKLFLVYVLFYSITRFLLDFMRIDKTMLSWVNMGVNQVISLIIIMGSVFLLLKRRQGELRSKRRCGVLVLTAIYIFIATIILMMFNFNNQSSQSQRLFEDLSDGEVITISIGEKFNLQTEIANTFESTQQGLSGREKIGSDGLLFVFPESALRIFWMFDMKFDLDFVWINGNKVVGFSKNIKKPILGTNNQDIERVSINKYSDKVLEFNSGDIDKYNLEVGDVVIIK